jgi:hypothetical protein
MAIHHFRWDCLVAMAVAVAAMGSLSLAQDVVEAVERDEADAPRRPREISDEAFDRLVFGSGGVDQFRRRMELNLIAHVRDVDKVCSLTAAQEKKLLLAGRGDIKRYFDRVEQARVRFDQGAGDRVEPETMIVELQRLNRAYRPEFLGASSLLSKSLKNTLTPEQFDRFVKVTRDRAVAHHRATVAWVVGVMDTTLRLTSRQHRQLEELLIKETKPPRRFGEYDYYGVMFQVSRLPERRLRPILDDNQWGKLSLQLTEAIRLERTLKDEGFVPDDQMADMSAGRRDRPSSNSVQPRS